MVPSVLQPNFLGTTKLKIEWAADDPDVKKYNETIGINIQPEVYIQIAMWLSYKGNHDYCYYYYTPLIM